LYDAAIEPSAGVTKKESVDSSNVVSSAGNRGQTPNQSVPSSSSTSNNSSRRYQLYVSNMTWWTTDEDLTKIIESYGVTDLLEIRFAENRQNGQSRGFATITTGSEASGKIIMDRLPGRQLHGNLLSVLPFNKHSLQKLEDASKGSAPQEKKEDKSNVQNWGTVRIGPGAPIRPMQMVPMNGLNNMQGQMMGFGNSSNMAVNMMQMRPPMQQSGQMMGGMSQVSQMNRPPPSFQNAVVGPPGVQLHSNVNTAQTMNSLLRNHQSSNALLPPGTGNVPAGTYINPQVYPHFAQQPNPVKIEPGFRQEIPPNEFEEIMNRNKTVSSSAITRAMNDAAAGDISSAISTLNTAISLIRQSKISGDDACRGLIRTLEDALSSVESKSDYSSRKHRRRSRSREHSRTRERSRSRDRSSRDSRSHRHKRPRDEHSKF
jgi:cleavage and polyadenylation specificity factor subunit 6/7